LGDGGAVGAVGGPVSVGVGVGGVAAGFDPVVACAGWSAVVGAGGAPVSPRSGVVDLGVANLAASPDTSPVEEFDGGAGGAGEQSPSPSEVDDGAPAFARSVALYATSCANATRDRGEPAGFVRSVAPRATSCANATKVAAAPVGHWLLAGMPDFIMCSGTRWLMAAFGVATAPSI
jgi:hypothetical protein